MDEGLWDTNNEQYNSVNFASRFPVKGRLGKWCLGCPLWRSRCRIPFKASIFGRLF